MEKRKKDRMFVRSFERVDKVDNALSSLANPTVMGFAVGKTAALVDSFAIFIRFTLVFSTIEKDRTFVRSFL